MLKTLLSAFALLMVFGAAAQAADCCDEAPDCCEEAAPCCDA